MPDVNMPGGESFVGPILYGKGYFRKKLGVDVTVGWQLDTSEGHPQIRQILKLGGYKSFWFFPAWPIGNPSEFLWEGIDGSRSGISASHGLRAYLGSNDAAGVHRLL